MAIFRTGSSLNSLEWLVVSSLSPKIVYVGICWKIIRGIIASYRNSDINDCERKCNSASVGWTKCDQTEPLYLISREILRGSLKERHLFAMKLLSLFFYSGKSSQLNWNERS